MSVSSLWRQAFLRMTLIVVMCVVGLLPPAQALAQVSTPPGGSSGGIITKTCEPNVCFTSQAAKDKYAKDNQCKFLEDVCSKTKPENDNVGAKPEDAGFWGGLWNDVKSALTYGYEFVKGLFAGLKEQVTDLYNLISDPAEAVKGLIALGKAFFDDPKGTLATMAELLGQEAVDTITKATQCGAYDLGKVVGGYVSPAFSLKLATRLTKFSGKLADAAKAFKHDFGCASFAAGTLVMTAGGMTPIEAIAAGQEVLSRNETSYADRPQAVTVTFDRTAPSYRELSTEGGSFRVTGEHPLWVQGKGWTIADQVVVDDVIAGQQSDVLVTANDEVKEPLRVYNFSVAYTANYFVGPNGIWAHNASCNIGLYTKAWAKLTPKEKGFRAERDIYVELKSKGYQPVGNSFKPEGKSPDDLYKEWDGQTGIDALYKDKDGNYVIVESKATGGKKSSDPEGCVGALCKMKTDDKERQLSDKWIKDRLAKMVPDPVERAKILQEMRNGSVKKVYAQTDVNGTTYHLVNDVNDNDVKIGKVWNP